jgi:hypothetical protein
VSESRTDVAAETRDGVGVAHRLFDQRGDFAKHAVARHVAAAVVHDLEAVEIEIAEDVARLVRVRELQRFFEPALELATVHQAGERIVARLVGHLARDAAQLADVAHHDHGADEVALLRAQRCHGQLDRALFAAAARDHQAAAAHGHLRLGGQAMPHRIAQRAAVALVEQRDDVGNALADRIDRADADQLLADLVDVVDAPADVGGDHPFAERIECLPGSGPRARRDGHGGRPWSHLDQTQQQGRAALVIDAHCRQLGARGLTGLGVQLDFQPLQPRLAGQRATQVLAHEIGVVGMDQLGQRLALQAERIVAADQLREAIVREHDVLAMHRQRFVQTAEQADQRALALVDHQVLHRELLEQAIGVIG